MVPLHTAQHKGEIEDHPVKHCLLEALTTLLIPLLAAPWLQNNSFTTQRPSFFHIKT